MLKRVSVMLVIALVLVAVLPITAFSLGNDNVYDVGERIVFGGYAVDLGDDTYYGGEKLIKTSGGEETTVLDLPARSLNIYNGRIYFISGDSVCVCDPDGSDLKTIFNSDEEINCLYALDGGIYFMLGGRACRLKNGKAETLFTRNGMAGFYPLTDEKFVWLLDNPAYEPIDESGDEVWEDEIPAYFRFVADIGGGEDEQYTGADAAVTASGDYSGPVVTVGSVTLPLAEHMPGTFFTKNGEACTCHHTGSSYCVQSVGNCNCMRYYPTGYKETCKVDLLGAQCFAFARMVFWRCFGFIDHSMNSSLYYNVGTLEKGKVTENNVKALLRKAAPGAHVRLAKGHSVSILTMDDDFIVVYQGNAGGDGVATQPCVVSTRRFTWAQFADYASAGVLYVNMPYSYPDSSLVESDKEIGYYRIKTDLYLRAEPNTNSEKLTILPKESIIRFSEIDGLWGKAAYGDYEGWAFLEYTTYYTREKISPVGDTFFLDNEGYIRGAVWKLDTAAFTENFDKQSITVLSPTGAALSGEEPVKTGCVAAITVEGIVIDKATVCLSGDVNGNGILDVGDYICIKRQCLGTYKASGVALAAEDANADGKVDSKDYLFVRRVLNGTYKP